MGKIKTDLEKGNTESVKNNADELSDEVENTKEYLLTVITLT